LRICQLSLGLILASLSTRLLQTRHWLGYCHFVVISSERFARLSFLQADFIIFPFIGLRPARFFFFIFFIPGVNMRQVSSMIILALAVAGVMGCDSKTDRKARYLDQGKEHLEEKNFDKARISLKNVLQIDPNDQEGLFYFGKLHEEKADFQQAFGIYSKVLEINPKHLEANLALTRFYLAANVLDKAENHLAVTESISPDSPDVKAMRAAFYVRKGDSKLALEMINGILASSPNHRESLALKIGILNDAQSYAEAQATLDAALKTHADDRTFLTLQSRVYQKQGKMDLAWDVYEKIAALEPDNFSKITDIAKIFIQNNQPDRAMKLLDTFIAANKDNMDSKVAKTELLAFLRKPEEANALLDTYKAQNPKEYRFHLAQANLMLQMGKRQEAVQQLSELTTLAVDDPAELKAHNLLARIYFEDKDLDKAQKAVDTVLKKSSKDLDALEIRGILALQRQDFIQAIGDFRSVLADKPTQVKLYSALANAHLGNSEPELAITALRDGVKANPSYAPIKVELANALLRSNDTPGAIDQLEQALKFDAKNAQAMDRLVNIYLEQNNGNAIRRLSMPLQEDESLGLLARYYTALSYSADANYAKSVELLDKILVEKPEFIEVISAKAKALVKMDKPELAKAWLKDQAAKFPAIATVHNLLGELMLRSSDWPKAIEAFKNAIRLQDTWPVPYSHMANALVKNNDIKTAEATLQEGLQKAPGSILLLNDLGSLYETQKLYDKSISLYESFYSKNGQQDIIGNNLAMLLATYKSDPLSNQQALRIAERLRASKNPLFLDTAGWVYFKNGRLDDAKTLLTQASSKLDSPVIHYHLGAVYLAEKDMVSAKYHLEKSLASSAVYPGRSDAQTLLKSVLSQ
jgi:tetratricopeptide (TPR) repeat protein